MKAQKGIFVVHIFSCRKGPLQNLKENTHKGTIEVETIIIFLFHKNTMNFVNL